MVRHDFRGAVAPALVGLVLALALPAAVRAQSGPALPAPATSAPAASTPAPPLPPASSPQVPPGRGAAPGATSGGAAPAAAIVHKVVAANDRLEMTVTTSRILTLEQKIPQAQVNNPEVLELTPLSPNQIQVFAKKPGVTQVNLWGENNRIFTIDVVVLADAKELEMLLRAEFPNSALRIRPVSQGVLISGYVDYPQQVSRIIQLAEEYYPKVINNITVGGVQKVVLHTKVMEVSRTNLRNLGIDWAQMSNGGAVISSAAGLITAVTAGSELTLSENTSLFFQASSGANTFFGVLEAMRQQNLMKVLAEPNLVTISGRPASFNVGGEIPILVPQSMGTVSIEYKKYGTQIDFVPIVLGNGQIRLEVRPRVSEIDDSRSVTVDSYQIPALRTREAETGVEMKAGQTLAIAGLVQDRVESSKRGLPWVGDLPYVGTFFRRVHENHNEVELLILVTPELIEAMDPEEVPPCGPGSSTTTPSDHELYWKGHIEVPACCGVCGGVGCAACRLRGVDTPACGSAEPASAPAAGSASRSATPARVAARPSGKAAPSGSYNRSSRQNSSSTASRAESGGALPGFLGPVGYDAAEE